MSEVIGSSLLNNGNINVTFSLEDGQTKRAQLRPDFELDNFIKVIDTTLSSVAVEQCYFYLNDTELLLGDKVSFRAHKHLVTDGCIIIVKDPPGE